MLVFWGLISAILLPFLVFFLSFLASPLTTTDGIVRIAVLGGVGSFLASVTVAGIGHFYCCTVPPESGARRFAIGSVICFVLGLGTASAILVFYVGRMDRFFVQLMGTSEEAALLVSSGLFLAGMLVAGHLQFILFLRYVGCAIRNAEVARLTNYYFGLWAVTMAVGFLAALAFVLPYRLGESLFVCCAVLLPCLAFIGLVWFLVLLDVMRRALSEAL